MNPNQSAEPGRQASLSDYLAAERTLLAWIRTGLALMGFGFVVARFGVFLQEFQLTQHGEPVRAYGLSLWFGTVLIVVGVLVNLGAGWRHARLVRDLGHGDTRRARSSAMSVAVAFALALVGLAMAIYLLSIQHASESGKERSMTLRPDEGIVDRPSKHSVDQTVERLVKMLQAKGVTLFALVDHSGEAEKVGMKMRPTRLLIFGNPRAGTPVMLAAPHSALDLPLKLLVWEDKEDKVWVTYNSPRYLLERHNLPETWLQTLAVVETLASQAGE
jgi:uncharacterized protein (DUF302 family)/uncharacterized membrane protein YidH (DUF202 family)